MYLEYIITRYINYSRILKRIFAYNNDKRNLYIDKCQKGVK